jgi:hypothetical protein
MQDCSAPGVLAFAEDVIELMSAFGTIQASFVNVRFWG